jgi:hypothetical protein
MYAVLSVKAHNISSKKGLECNVGQMQILRWKKATEDVIISKAPKSALPIKLMLLSQTMRSAINRTLYSTQIYMLKLNPESGGGAISR